MKVGDLVRWRDPIDDNYRPLLFGVVTEPIKRGWVYVYWFVDNVPENPTREPIPQLELLNETR